jgi:putative transposase
MGRINHELVMAGREIGVSRSEIAWAGRQASPSLAIVDAQSVKCDAPQGERGGACPRAGEAGPVGWR